MTWSDTRWTSIYGVPIVPFMSTDPSTYNYNFTIQSAYLNFDCSFLNVTTMDVIHAANPNIVAGQSGTLFMAMSTAMNDTTPGQLAFASSIFSANQSIPYNSTFAYSVCSFKQAFVDSKLVSSDNTSIVTAMKLTSSPPPFTYSGFNTTTNFVAASGQTQVGTHTDTERYIYNGDVTSAVAGGSVDISTVSLADFTARLSILFKT